MMIEGDEKLNEVIERTILENMKNSIMKNSEIVITSMKGHFGKEKYIIIFSYSNGLDRAKVFKVMGNSTESAWNNGLDLVRSQLKKSGDTIRWFKVEIVNLIEEQSYADFCETIAKTKSNYFRMGISFDFMFNQAFTDMEINGNAFIKLNKTSNKKELSYSNINYYKKNNLKEKDSINDEG